MLVAKSPGGEWLEDEKEKEKGKEEREGAGDGTAGTIARVPVFSTCRERNELSQS